MKEHEVILRKRMIVIIVQKLVFKQRCCAQNQKTLCFSCDQSDRKE